MTNDTPQPPQTFEAKIRQSIRSSYLGEQRFDLNFSEEVVAVAIEADKQIAEARQLFSRLVELDRIGLEGVDDDIERQEKYMRDSFEIMQQIKAFLAKGGNE